MSVHLTTCASCGRKAYGEKMGNEVSIGALTGWTWNGDGWRCPKCENATPMHATWERRRKRDDRIFTGLWVLVALVSLTAFAWRLSQ